MRTCGGTDCAVPIPTNSEHRLCGDCGGADTWPDLSDYDRALTGAADAGLCAAPDECSPLSVPRSKYSREIKSGVHVE